MTSFFFKCLWLIWPPFLTGAILLADYSIFNFPSLSVSFCLSLCLSLFASLSLSFCLCLPLNTCLFFPFFPEQLVSYFISFFHSYGWDLMFFIPKCLSRHLSNQIQFSFLKRSLVLAFKAINLTTSLHVFIGLQKHVL